MRVAMYYSNNDLRTEEQPVPALEEGELLVRVHASGLCGTDVLQWYRIDKIPLVLGHEIAGEIAAIGKGVKGYKVGDRISASHHVPCGRCSFCLNGHETVCDMLRTTKFYPGGFSEYVRLPAINVKLGVYRLPDNVSYDEATFIEPLACVLRGQSLAGMSKGKSVMIIGSGISGLLHLQLARINGASKIVSSDIVDFRLRKARELGADLALDARDDLVGKFKGANGGRLADLVILCTGARPAMEQALASVERGGTILFFAATDKGVELALPVNDLFWRNEVTLMSSYAATPKEHIQALGLISDKKVDVKTMITHRLPLAQAQVGFGLVAKAGESIKVIIEPQK